MIQNVDISGQGFSVLKDYKSWRIANLGYDEASNSINGIKTLGRHLETDEVFVLIRGYAYMITAGFDICSAQLEVEKLEEGKIYTIKEKQWHGALLKPDSMLLIIENENTSELNSEVQLLNENEKLRILNIVKSL